MSLDQEFMISQNANYFINTMFGWPMLPAADMPGGGPAYPLSALGARVRARPTDTITLLAGVVNGSPVANNSGDPQMRNPSGTSFPAQWRRAGDRGNAIRHHAVGPPAAADAIRSGSPALYKIGIWYDNENFADQRYDTTGLSLANPASSGIPASHRGDYAIYAIADQMIYRWSDDPGRNINLFLRPSIAPQQDRNFISFSLNAGLTVHGLVPGRNDDTFGFGAAFTRVSDSVTGLSLDTAYYNPGVFSPARTNETVIEATYQYQVDGVVPDSTGHSICLQSGRGNRQPGHPDPKNKERSRSGRTSKHHLLRDGICLLRDWRRSRFHGRGFGPSRQFSRRDRRGSYACHIRRRR